MTRKRVDKLQPGDRMAYRNDWWVVTRVRNPHIGDYRSIWIRSPHDPHPIDELMWSAATIVEVSE